MSSLRNFFIFFVILAGFLFFSPSSASAADRFWVGGTGNLDGVDTTHISATSGGAGGASYPGAGDTLTFDANSGGGTVTFTAGVTLTSLTMGAFTGTIDFNDQTVSATALTISGTGTRTIDLGASAISTNTWNALTTTNLTFIAGTSTITHLANTTFNGGGLSYANVILNGLQPSLAGANTFVNLTRNGSNTINLILFDNQIITGTLTINGTNAGAGRDIIQSSVKGTARTITANAISMSNVDFQDIIAAGASAPWDLSAITGGSGDAGGNSNITFTPAQTNYWIGGTGNWSDVAEWANSSGGASSSGRVPLVQDTARFDASSFSAGSQTVTGNVRRIGSVNWTGATNSPTWNMNTAASFFGSITTISGMTFSGNQAYTYEGRGSSTLTSGGKQWNTSFTINCANGTLSLGDALTLLASATVTLTSGTFNTGGFSVSTAGFIFTGTAARTLTMTGTTWTITADGNNSWNASTNSNLTVNATGSVVRFTFALAADRTLFRVANSFTWGRVEIATTGAFANQFFGSHTFNDGIYIDATTEARTIKFTTGTTTTMGTLGRLDATTNIITIDSTTTGTHTLTKSGGGTVSLDYLNIQHSIATPSNTWFAGANSTNNQGVATAGSGWLFTANAPASPTALGPTSYVTGVENIDSTPTFTFTLTDPDVADTVQYRIQLDDTSDFSSPLIDYTSALAAQGSTSFTVGQAAGSGTYTLGSEGQTLTDGSYYLRVKAIDQATAESSYTTANSGAIAFIMYTPSSKSGSRPKSRIITTTTTTTNPTLCIINTNILKLSSRGADVSCLQQNLNILLPTNLVTDGIFGPLTRAAVVNFQTKNNLVPDGIVGPLTKGVMR